MNSNDHDDDNGVDHVHEGCDMCKLHVPHGNVRTCANIVFNVYTCANIIFRKKIT